ncbi:MAG: hypothetical protein OEV44_04105, partial [Spirochaetota bacterium]|nr:hypothetical protein [Spirochaetota bacterium]
MKKLFYLLIFLFFALSMCVTQNVNTETIYHAKSYNIDVHVYPLQQELFGVAKINVFVKGQSKVIFLLNNGLNIKSIYYAKKFLSFKRKIKSNSSLSFIEIDLADIKQDNIPITISYNGKIFGLPKLKSKIPDQSNGVISPTGVYLDENSGWYPFMPYNLAFYKLKVSIPQEYAPVSEGNIVSNSIKSNMRVVIFKSKYLLTPISLIAGKYHVNNSTYNNIQIGTYFSKENNHLSDTYIKYTKYYLNLYERMISPYPYSKFFVIDNFLPTGYGMPSFTAIGGNIIRLPFIVKTSLGHEILHNWWGNS